MSHVRAKHEHSNFGLAQPNWFSGGEGLLGWRMNQPKSLGRSQDELNKDPSKKNMSMGSNN